MTTGLVIAGAGARGAYEAGALSVLVPWLADRGEGPRIVVGTSAGAINAALFASLCHAQDVTAGMDAALAVWRNVSRQDVFRSVLLTGPITLARYLADITGLSGVLGLGGVESLLDPTPLRRTLEAFDHWPDLHLAVEEGLLDALAVIATSTSRGRTEVMVEAGPAVDVPAADPARGVEYVRTLVGPEHVMASSAIPVAFPPVQLGRDWYLDGGVRLNAPIKPAIELGAQRLVIVATHPLAATTDPVDDAPATGVLPAPDVFTAAAAVVTSVLVDRMVEDVRSLDRVNRLVHAGAEGTRFREVPYVFVGPRRADAIAQLAEEVLATNYDGIGGLFGGDFAVMNRLVGGSSTTHGELLSFLLFDEDFIDLLIDLGRRDAQARIDVLGDDPWRLTHPPASR